MLFTENDCAAWLEAFAAKVDFVELDKAEIVDALKKASSRGIRGGRVYDYIHALASDKAKADELLTRNTNDFIGLAKAVIVWP